MNTELFGEPHEEEEYGLFGKEHERQQCFLYGVSNRALWRIEPYSSLS